MPSGGRIINSDERDSHIQSIKGNISRYEGDEYRDGYGNIRCPYNEILEDLYEQLYCYENIPGLTVYNMVEQYGYLADIRFLNNSTALPDLYKSVHGLRHLSDEDARTIVRYKLHWLHNQGYMMPTIEWEYEKWRAQVIKIRQGDSEKMMMKERAGSHSFILIDPPYAGDVNYAELSEFFLAWDKKILSEIFPNWSTESSRKQAVEFNFEAKMLSILKQCHRVLHDEGTLILFFASKKKAVWQQLKDGLTGSGFHLVKFHTITTEPNAAGIRKGNRYNISMVMVCKKQPIEFGNSQEIYESKIAEYEFSDVDKTNIKWCAQIMSGDELT